MGAETLMEILGLSSLAVGSFAAGMVEHNERIYALNKLNDLYLAGKLDIKPTYFNVWGFYEKDKCNLKLIEK